MNKSMNFQLIQIDLAAHVSVEPIGEAVANGHVFLVDLDETDRAGSNFVATQQAHVSTLQIIGQ